MLGVILGEGAFPASEKVRDGMVGACERDPTERQVPREAQAGLLADKERP